MNVRPVPADRDVTVTPPPWPDGAPAWSDGAPHAGFLDGATATGEAARHGLSVRIGLWLAEDGSVRHARWRATKDTALRACAEAACVLLEAGADPATIDASSLRGVAGDGSLDAEPAELVVGAVQAGAWMSRG